MTRSSLDPRPGDFTLCRRCGLAIELLRTRNPDTKVFFEFWAHSAALRLVATESHLAVPKRFFTDVW